MSIKFNLVTVDGDDVYQSESTTGIPLSYLLAKSAVPVSSTNDTNETAFATIPIAGNTIGNNGQLRVSTIWACTNNSNSKTIRVRYSGGAGVPFLSANITASAGVSAVTNIGNNNSTFAQVGGSQAVTTSGLPFGYVQGSTAAADTSAATSVVITGQKATGTDTLTLQSYVVEVMPGA